MEINDLNSDSDWTTGGDWNIHKGLSIDHPSDKNIYGYMVQIIERMYEINAFAEVTKGYIEIFLDGEMILKIDDTSEYRTLFKTKRTGEAEFIMKASDDCEIIVHNCEIKPFENPECNDNRN